MATKKINLLTLKLRRLAEKVAMMAEMRPCVDLAYVEAFAKEWDELTPLIRKFEKSVKDSVAAAAIIKSLTTSTPKETAQEKKVEPPKTTEKPKRGSAEAIAPHFGVLKGQEENYNQKPKKKSKKNKGPVDSATPVKVQEVTFSPIQFQLTDLGDGTQGVVANPVPVTPVVPQQTTAITANKCATNYVDYVMQVTELGPMYIHRDDVGKLPFDRKHKMIPVDDNRVEVNNVKYEINGKPIVAPATIPDPVEPPVDEDKLINGTENVRNPKKPNRTPAQNPLGKFKNRITVPAKKQIEDDDEDDDRDYDQGEPVGKQSYQAIIEATNGDKVKLNPQEQYNRYKANSQSEREVEKRKIADFLIRNGESVMATISAGTSIPVSRVENLVVGQPEFQLASFGYVMTEIGNHKYRE